MWDSGAIFWQITALQIDIHTMYCVTAAGHHRWIATKFILAWVSELLLRDDELWAARKLKIRSMGRINC